MPSFCFCFPCTSDSDDCHRPLAALQRSYEGVQCRIQRPQPTHRHGLLLKVEEILIRQCESEDSRHRLLKFAEKVLSGTEAVHFRAEDTVFLQIILKSLPEGEEYRTDCHDFIKVLEKDGIKMSVMDSVGDTPLLRAIKSGNRGALYALLYTECDINATDKYSSTCLIYAVQRNDKETVQTILQLFPKSVNLDKTDYANYTALAYAASNNNIQLCALLLDAGARTDVNSTSPLYLAVSNNASYGLIQLLISHGSSVNVSNSDGFSVLAAAAKNNRPRIVSLLLENGANFSIPWYKNPAFNIALGMDQIELIKIFIRYGVDVMCVNPKNCSVVHEACCHGSAGFLEYALSTTNVNLDIRNRQKLTAAHLAAQYGHNACLKVLFYAGADCWSLDPRGQTALELALFHNRSNCVSFFVKHPVFPRQTLFSKLHMLHNDYDPDALSRKPAVKHYSSYLLSEWNEDEQVDTLENMCIITIRRLLGQKSTSKLKQLPLPEKVKGKILSYS